LLGSFLNAVEQTLSLSIGDKIELRAVAFASSTKLLVDDLTTGMWRSTTVNEGGASSASVGVRKSAVPYITDFGQILWTHVTLNGVPFGSSNPVAFNLTTSAIPPKVLVHTAPLSPGGESFKSTWITAR
jgi:hypothetical protein